MDSRRRRSSLTTGLLVVSFVIGKATAQYPFRENSSLPWFNVRLPTARTTTLSTTEETEPPEVPDIVNEITRAPLTTTSSTTTSTTTRSTTTEEIPEPTTTTEEIPVEIPRLITITHPPKKVIEKPKIPQKPLIPSLPSSFRWAVWCKLERKYAPRCKSWEEVKKMPATGTIWQSGAQGNLGSGVGIVRHG